MVTIDKAFLRTFIDSLNTLNVSSGIRFQKEASGKQVGGVTKIEIKNQINI